MTSNDNDTTAIIQDILAELARAEHLHPVFPSVGRRGDHVYAASILSEERGEVVRSANSWQMEGRGSVLHIRSELVHCGAMVLRYLLNLEKIERQRINEGARQELHEEHNVHIEPDSPVWLPSVIRVKIVGAGNKAWWYSGKVGEVFEVWKRGDHYEVMGGSNVRYIAFQDARVLGDNESQNLNDSDFWDTEPVYNPFVVSKKVEL